MTRRELAEHNVGQNLDDLSNLDPRGYGVCRVLYAASRELAGEPTSMRAARVLSGSIAEGSVVVIVTGFVLLPHGKAEMDGMVSSMLLARSLTLAFGAKPLVVCPEDCVASVRRLAPAVGLHLYETVADLAEYPISMGVRPFTKDASRAEAEADEIVAEIGRATGGKPPSAVVTIEAPGANALGVYHNAAGNDVTALEAKSDALFSRLQALGVPDVSIGDLGNEIGMGALGAHLGRYIPGAAKGACACGCGGGIAAATASSAAVTATVSDWGCYAMIGALAFILGKPDIMPDGKLVGEVISEASRSGLVDMKGWLVPAVDGCDSAMNAGIANLMRQTVSSALEQAASCGAWFDRTLALGFFEASAT
jgi:hypothetical protein